MTLISIRPSFLHLAIVASTTADLTCLQTIKSFANLIPPLLLKPNKFETFTKLWGLTFYTSRSES